MTDISFQPAQERIISDLDTLKVYFDTTRLRIMKAVGVRPCSVSELAGYLNVPFTRLYYHINLLEKHDLIRMVDVRSISGAAEEKYYRATARLYVIDRTLLTVGTPDGDAGLELLLSTVIDFTKADIIHSVAREVIDMSKYPPDPAALVVRRGVYNLTDEGASALHEKLRDFLLDVSLLDQTPDTPDTHYYGAMVAFYPTTLELPDSLLTNPLPRDEE
jgi:DNA-binding transcriptional ArsR family regulator